MTFLSSLNLFHSEDILKSENSAFPGTVVNTLWDSFESLIFMKNFLIMLQVYRIYGEKIY